MDEPSIKNAKYKLLDHQDPDGDHDLFLDGETEQVQFKPIEDLDEFFKKVYNYFLEKGAYCIIVSRILNILSVLFMIFMVTFLVVYVDWNEVLTCVDAACAEVSLIRQHALRHLSTFQKTVIGLELAHVCYLVYLIVRFIGATKQALEMRTFYRTQLGITQDIGTLEWGEVVMRLVKLQDSHKYSIVKRLNEHDIVSRIMRKENYVIAFINKGLLNLSFPFSPRQNRFLAWALGSGGPNDSNKAHMPPVLTRMLEWNLLKIMDWIFDEKFEMKGKYVSDPRELRKLFRVAGVANAVAAPFILFYLFVSFAFQHVMEAKEHAGTFFGMRKWTPWARWTFREFNELPHVFQRRLKASFKPAVKYCEQFPSPLLSFLGNWLIFVVGGFAACIVLLTVLNSDLLVFSNVMGQNLYWYLGIFGTIIAAAKGLVIPDDEVYDPNHHMKAVSEHTHYLPKRWRSRAHTHEVREEFLALFQLRVIQLLNEMVSVCTTPVILYFSLPLCADDIVDFIKDTTAHVEGVGHVCAFANFDFSNHGNVKYGSSMMAEKRERSKQGKMEKSFVNFMSNHPSWVPHESTGAAQMLTNISIFDNANAARSAFIPGDGHSVHPSMMRPGGGASAAPNSLYGLLSSPHSTMMFGSGASSATPGTRLPPNFIASVGNGRMPSLQPLGNSNQMIQMEALGASIGSSTTSAPGGGAGGPSSSMSRPRVHYPFKALHRKESVRPLPLNKGDVYVRIESPKHVRMFEQAAPLPPSSRQGSQDSPTALYTEVLDDDATTTRPRTSSNAPPIELKPVVRTLPHPSDHFIPSASVHQYHPRPPSHPSASSSSVTFGQAHARSQSAQGYMPPQHRQQIVTFPQQHVTSAVHESSHEETESSTPIGEELDSLSPSPPSVSPQYPETDVQQPQAENSAATSVHQQEGNSNFVFEYQPTNFSSDAHDSLMASATRGGGMGATQMSAFVSPTATVPTGGDLSDSASMLSISTGPGGQLFSSSHSNYYSMVDQYYEKQSRMAEQRDDDLQ